MTILPSKPSLGDSSNRGRPPDLSHTSILAQKGYGIIYPYPFFMQNLVCQLQES